MMLNSDLVLTNENSMALVARNQDDYQKARTLYAKARKLAEELKQTPVLAMIESNLGMWLNTLVNLGPYL